MRQSLDYFPAAKPHYFNPRTYVRCDAFSFKYSGILRYFNPRTYVRCDLKCLVIKTHLLNFNPRTYVRCDTDILVQFTLSTNFNPRTYVRCDYVSIRFNCCLVVFQSTHLREVRLKCNYAIFSHRNFNPRTYVRCDLLLLV